MLAGNFPCYSRLVEAAVDLLLLLHGHPHVFGSDTPAPKAWAFL